MGNRSLTRLSTGEFVRGRTLGELLASNDSRTKTVRGPRKFLINVDVGNGLEVTYDDSRHQYWLYKAPHNPPHPSEIFHVKTLQSGKIRIYGFTYSPSVKWFLTVEELSNGRVETYPRFRTEDQISQASSGSTIHKTFSQKYKEGLLSLGFAKKDKEMVYMKPHISEKRIMTTEVEHFCFQIPEEPLTDKHLLLLNIDWHWAIEAREELDGK